MDEKILWWQFSTMTRVNFMRAPGPSHSAILKQLTHAKGEAAKHHPMKKLQVALLYSRSISRKCFDSQSTLVGGRTNS
eukprot:jgi/Botrbrau1/6664/Bobra.0202s0012.1